MIVLSPYPIATVEIEQQILQIGKEEVCELMQWGAAPRGMSEDGAPEVPCLLDHSDEVLVVMSAHFLAVQTFFQ